MLNMIQEGKAVDMLLTAVVLSGGVVVNGALAGVATTDGAVGDTIAVSLEGVFELPKAAGTALGLGSKVYWDNTAKAVVTAATNNTQIGYVVYAASADAVKVAVKLWPN